MGLDNQSLWQRYGMRHRQPEFVAKAQFRSGENKILRDGGE